MPGIPQYNYGRGYSPTEPYAATGYGFIDNMRFLHATGLIDLPGFRYGSLNSPSADVFSQESKMKSDETFRAMMQHGARMQNEQLAQFMAYLSSGQRLGGQPYTAAQQEGFRNLANTINTYATGTLAMTDSRVRTALDIFAGGSSGANTAYGFGLMNRQMLDPLSLRPNLSTYAGSAIHSEYHKELFGGGRLDRQTKLGSLTSADMPVLMAVEAQRGAYSGTRFEQDLRQNPYVREAIQRGDFGSDADYQRLNLDRSRFTKILGWQIGDDDIATRTFGAMDASDIDRINQSTAAATFNRRALRTEDLTKILSSGLTAEISQRILDDQATEVEKRQYISSGFSPADLERVITANVTAAEIQAQQQQGIADTDIVQAINDRNAALTQQPIPSAYFDTIAQSKLLPDDAAEIARSNFGATAAQAILSAGLRKQDLQDLQALDLSEEVITGWRERNLDPEDMGLISEFKLDRKKLNEFSDEEIAEQTGQRLTAEQVKRLRELDVTDVEREVLGELETTPELLRKFSEGALDSEELKLFAESDFGDRDVQRIAASGFEREAVDRLTELGLSTTDIDQIAAGRTTKDTLERIRDEGMSAADYDEMTTRALSEDDPEGQTALFESIGKRMARVSQDTAAALNAVRQIYDPKSIKSIEETTQAMEHFTGLYNRQLRGKQIADIVRRSNSALGEYGYGFEELSARQEYAAGVVNQAGLAQFMTPIIALQAAEHTAGLLRSGADEARGYGVLNPAQMDEFKIRQDTAVATSRELTMMAAILTNAEEIGLENIDQTDEGERIKKILRNIRAGVATGDEQWDQLTPEEQALAVSNVFSNEKGLYGQIMIDSNNEFAMASRIAEEGLYVNAAPMLRAKHKQYVSMAAAAQTINSELSDVSVESRNDLLPEINTVLNDSLLSLSGTQVSKDRVGTQRIMGSAVIARLEALAATDDPGSEGAREMLANIDSSGKSRREYGEVIARRYRDNLEGAMNDNAANLVHSIGDIAQSAARDERNRGKIKSAIQIGLDGSTNRSLEDALMVLAEDMGDPDRDPMTGMDEALNAMFKTTEDPIEKSRMRSMFEFVREQEESLQTIEETHGSDVAFNDELISRRKALAESKNNLRDMLEKQFKREEEEAAKALKEAQETATKNEEDASKPDAEDSASTSTDGVQVNATHGGVTINGLNLYLDNDLVASIKGTVRSNSERSVTEAGAKG